MLLPDSHGLGRVSPDEKRRKDSVDDSRDRLRRTILPTLTPADET